jgi:hypothetical protein
VTGCLLGCLHVCLLACLLVCLLACKPSKGSRPGLALRQPLLRGDAVQVISHMMEEGMRDDKLETVQSAAMVSEWNGISKVSECME